LDPAKAGPRAQTRAEVQVHEKVVPSASGCRDVEPILQSKPRSNDEDNHGFTIVN
jgi:hypothetical protein